MDGSHILSKDIGECPSLTTHDDAKLTPHPSQYLPKSSLKIAPGQRILSSIQSMTHSFCNKISNGLSHLNPSPNNITLFGILVFTQLMDLNNAQDFISSTTVPPKKSSTLKFTDNSCITLLVSGSLLLIGMAIYLKCFGLQLLRTQASNSENTNLFQFPKSEPEYPVNILTSNFIPSSYQIKNQNTSNIEDQKEINTLQKKQSTYLNNYELHRKEQTTFGFIVRGILGNDSTLLKLYGPALFSHMVNSNNLINIIKKETTFSDLIETTCENICLAQMHMSVMVFILSTLQSVINICAGIGVETDQLSKKQTAIILLFSDLIFLVLQSAYKANLYHNNNAIKKLSQKTQYLLELSPKIGQSNGCLNKKCCLKNIKITLPQWTAKLLTTSETAISLGTLICNMLVISKAVQFDTLSSLFLSPMVLGTLSLGIFPMASQFSKFSTTAIFSHCSKLAIHQAFNKAPNSDRMSACCSGSLAFGSKLQGAIATFSNFITCGALGKVTMPHPCYKGSDVIYYCKQLCIENPNQDKPIESVTESHHVIEINSMIEKYSHVRRLSQTSGRSSIDVLTDIRFKNLSYQDLSFIKNISFSDYPNYIDQLRKLSC